MQEHWRFAWWSDPFELDITSQVAGRITSVSVFSDLFEKLNHGIDIFQMGDIPQNSSHQIEENAVLMTEMIRVKIGRCRTNLSCLQAGNISSAEDIENEKRWLCVKRKGKKKCFHLLSPIHYGSQGLVLIQHASAELYCKSSGTQPLGSSFAHKIRHVSLPRDFQPHPS